MSQGNNNENVNHIPEAPEGISRSHSGSHGDKDAPENANIQQVELDVNVIQREDDFFVSHPNIQLVKCGQRREIKIINKKVKMIKSDTVITEITNGKPSSYLANPQNVEGKFYYLMRDSKTAIFNPTFAWREGLLNMVSLGEFSSFLTELNSLKSKTKAKIKESISKNKKIRYTLEYIGMILIFCAISLFIASPFVFTDTFLVLIGVAPSCLFVGIILLALGYYFYGEHYHSSFRLNHNEDMNEKVSLIKKWNEQLFMRKKVMLTYPKNMTYIQINTNPEWKLEIEDLKE